MKKYVKYKDILKKFIPHTFNSSVFPFINFIDIFFVCICCFIIFFYIMAILNLFWLCSYLQGVNRNSVNLNCINGIRPFHPLSKSFSSHLQYFFSSFFLLSVSVREYFIFIPFLHAAIKNWCFCLNCQS